MCEILRISMSHINSHSNFLYPQYGPDEVRKCAYAFMCLMHKEYNKHPRLIECWTLFIEFEEEIPELAKSTENSYGFLYNVLGNFKENVIEILSSSSTPKI